MTASKFDYANFNTSLNITYDEYEAGKWRMHSLNEEQLFDAVIPKLSDLVEKIRVDRIIEEIGDSYDSVKIDVNDATVLSDYGIDVIKKYYQNYLVNYCLDMR